MGGKKSLSRAQISHAVMSASMLLGATWDELLKSVSKSFHIKTFCFVTHKKMNTNVSRPNLSEKALPWLLTTSPSADCIRRTGNRQGAHSTHRFPNTETSVQGLPWESAGALCTGITRMWCRQKMVINRNVTCLIDAPNLFRFSLFSAFWTSYVSLFLVTIENCTKLCLC